MIIQNRPLQILRRCRWYSLYNMIVGEFDAMFPAAHNEYERKYSFSAIYVELIVFIPIGLLLVHFSVFIISLKETIHNDDFLYCEL